MVRPRVATVIPAYNEEATIENVILTCNAFSSVIVIDDYSNDDTAKLARRAGASVIRNSANLGYGKTLKTGLLAAIAENYEVVSTIDADGELNPIDLQKFFNTYPDFPFDYAAGVRTGNTGRQSENISSYLSNLTMGISDPFCGAKIYKVDALKKVLKTNTPIQTGCELGIQLVKDKCNFIEFKIDCSARHGRSRFGSGLKI